MFFDGRRGEVNDFMVSRRTKFGETAPESRTTRIGRDFEIFFARSIVTATERTTGSGKCEVITKVDSLISEDDVESNLPREKKSQWSIVRKKKEKALRFGGKSSQFTR